MRRSVRGTFQRKPPSVVQWHEQKIARDAAAAALRAAPAYVGPNAAIRGFDLNPGEFKSVDTVVSQAIDQTGAVTLVNGVARGDEINERTGRVLTMRSIQFNARAYATSGTGTDQVGRVLIVYDRQTNAAALTGAQVLASFDTNSPRNLENRRRFKILKDWRFPINATGESGSNRVLQFYRRLRHPVMFNSGDAGTVADITSGSIYVLTIGTNVAGATAGNLVGTCRIRYQDN